MLDTHGERTAKQLANHHCELVQLLALLLLAFMFLNMVVDMPTIKELLDLCDLSFGIKSYEVHKFEMIRFI